MNKNECIRCDAMKCRYHTDDDHCSADSIEVGTPCASCSDDTVCNTFAERAEE